jgi:plastocyanin
MTTNKALAAVLATAFAVAVACGGGDEPTGNNGNTGNTGNTGATGATGSTSTAIDVNDGNFSPSSTTVPVGSTITWTWQGAGTHNVTFSGGGGASGDKTMDGTFQKQFPTAGTFTYQCTFHGPAMSGTVTVQ